MKSGFIALVGRPSSGKSTLINTLCGEKVSAVSPKPQTTQRIVRGILTHQDHYQMVFVDTPGFYDIKGRAASASLNASISEALVGADAILYLLDTTRKIGSEERQLFQRVRKEAQCPVTIALTKIDLPSPFKREILSYALAQLDQKDIVPISAKNNLGLDTLIEKLETLLPEGQAFYDDLTLKTDQTMEEQFAEMIREQIFLLFGKEIPYHCTANVQDLEFDEERQIFTAQASIFVQKEAHKRMVIGHGGEKIHALRRETEKRIKKDLGKTIMFKMSVYLRKGKAIY